MALSENELHRYCCEARTIEGLASTLDIAIAIFDRNDTLIAVSTQFLSYFRVPPDLLVPGARLRDLLNAMYDAGAQVLGSLNGNPRSISREDWVAERIAIHWRERYESVEQLPDGRWIRMRKRRLPDGVLIATIQDVSEQKRRDTELSRIRHQAELAQHILDNLVNPVIVKDSALRYVIVNDAFCRIPGLHPKQVLGRTAKELVEPDLAARFEEVERRVLETGVPFDAIEDIYRSDGSVMNAITRARRSGTPGHYYVTVSFDDVSALAQNGMYRPDITSRYDADVPTAETGTERSEASPLPGTPAGRILILDQDRERSEIRVTELIEAGSDAVAIASADEAMAFLDAVKSFNLTISAIEMTLEMARSLSGFALSGHDDLRKAVEQRLAKGTPPVTRTSQASMAAPSRPEAAAAAETGMPDASTLSTPAELPGRVNPPVRDTPVSPGRNRIRVLVAEDNDVNQIVFEQILEGIGVDFRIVSNGQEAVAAWRAAVPDLILMDVSMPVMNGLQAAQAIRDAELAGSGDQAHVPIIAVTAHAMTGDRDRCFAAGMDDYLSKPVSPEKLESIIKKWIDRPDSMLAAG
ncbi:MAG: response regulator [Hoeflea sp.]|uniref:response regulator n=1 Tax=Hoeflea sp. TaxID=1940281 RepID=UPI001E0CE750|nr:response regulator [Hoeflea sp.]MBU4529107.1 response regulator [Alphaproteobacteria bacterium]MBU4543512.1 response regulator [Alphaproteobacteria bacterium]MBU4549137.1 response regulator [Alphaproteobacteria bacterium]MBV1725272.1 response regulator [Hoeflea sp.]MBV1785233.1 response regulator [Hoeflea sp.]